MNMWVCTKEVMNICRNISAIQYRTMPQIRSPFCNLCLSTKHRGGGMGGLYAGCDNFSRDYALPPLPVKHDLIVGGG